MTTYPASRTFKAALLLMGAFTFAFLVGEANHEACHYLAHLAFGHTGVGVHLDPFGGSRIVGVTSLPLNAMGMTSAAGPLLNLAGGITSAVLLWRRRHPALLPAQLWGPVAMVQEGITFSLGLLTPGGDAAWIVAWGVPAAVLVTIGVILLATGCVGTSRLLSGVVLESRDPLWITPMVLGLGMFLLHTIV